jgi:peptidoglycan/xylan/chitin deacetylase (PgdA/CDA1 family)
MRLPGNIRITQTLRRLRSRFRPGVAILGYHRVHDGADDPLGLSITPERFEAHLAIIARIAKPMRLADAARSLRTGNVPSRAVVVTFDDGYAGNLHVALPLLERYAVPATIFITSGNRGGEFWWDRLVRLRPQDPASGDFYALAVKLESLGHTEREEALRQLELRSSPTAAEPIHRSLTITEMQQLAASPLIDIGAHGVTHQPLPTLTVQEQQVEIGRSRQDLEELLHSEVVSFAYPHGALTPQTSTLVEKAGYVTACCSKVDVATADAPPLALPRLWVANSNGPEFERWLGGWLHGA